jgi:hypothetical protein
MKEQSYTSTLPMGRKAYTEPQWLYKGDLYFFYITHGRQLLLIIIRGKNFHKYRSRWRPPGVLEYFLYHITTGDYDSIVTNQ